MRARTSARLGADFVKLWTASAVSNLGDGITMVAGPLLVASLTPEPALIAGAVFAQQLPWLLFSLISGAYVDRLDRRRLIVTVDLLRGVALAALVVAVVTGTATIPVVYAVFFVLGTGETLADTASAAFLPTVVPADKLTSANARLMATFTVVNQFVAKPVGAGLFAITAALPFGVDALTFVVAAVLISAIRRRPMVVEPPGACASTQDTRTSLRTEIVAGVRWLWRHPLLRTLAVSMGVGNIAFCAAFAVFVVYARQRLGLAEVGYGVLLTTFAIGGLIGTAVAARLQSRFGAAALLRAGLVIEAATHTVLAATTAPLVAATILIIFGVHAMVWGVIVVTLRQRVVPGGMLGRVSSVYSLLDLGGAAVGSLLGGLFAQTLGIVAPFWIAAAVMTVVAVAAWPYLGAASAVGPDPGTRR